MTSPVLIARPQQSSNRIFPAITTDFYTQSIDTDTETAVGYSTTDQRAAKFLVALAYRQLTKAQLLLAHDLSPLDSLARLLIQHRLGFEAELSAQVTRADFYWQQVQTQLKVLSKQDVLWQAIATDIAREHPDAEVLNNAVALRQCLVEELLIDTHCGFYNGLSQGPQDADGSDSEGWGDRSFAHITFLEALLPLSALPSDAWLALLAQPWQQQLDRYRVNESWPQAISLCRHRLGIYPKSVAYQTELAEVEGAAILAKLKKAETQLQYQTNAQCLQKGIRRFEALAQTYPHNAAIYDYLGDLHHLYSIQLGNAEDVAAGLVAVEKALTYTPGLKGAISTRNNLTQLMQQIQARGEKIKASLKQQSRAHLTSEGKQVVNQARKGFSLRDNYLKSTQVAAIQSSVKLAQAMTLWGQISGLPPEPTESQAIALYDSLAQILKQPPPDKTALPDDWERLSQAQPDLAALPPAPICAFLEQRLWKTKVSDPIVTPPPLLENPVVLRPTQRATVPSHEPLVPWLFSRQDIGLKGQMAAAIAALLTAGSLGFYELSVRTTRARAYTQLITAAQNNQLLDVIDSAETFLARSPLSGRDAREPEVKQLYTQAFVQWSLQQPNTLDEKTLQRYQNLTVD
jgi:hypothetical protein